MAKLPCAHQHRGKTVGDLNSNTIFCGKAVPQKFRGYSFTVPKHLIFIIPMDVYNSTCGSICLMFARIEHLYISSSPLVAELFLLPPICCDRLINLPENMAQFEKIAVVGVRLFPAVRLCLRFSDTVCREAATSADSSSKLCYAMTLL